MGLAGTLRVCKTRSIRGQFGADRPRNIHRLGVEGQMITAKFGWLDIATLANQRHSVGTPWLTTSSRILIIAIERPGLIQPL